MDIKLVYINSGGSKREIFISHATIKLELNMFSPKHIRAWHIEAINPLKEVVS